MRQTSKQSASRDAASAAAVTGAADVVGVGAVDWMSSSSSLSLSESVALINYIYKEYLAYLLTNLLVLRPS